jgi:hypothetical protein
MDYLSVKSTERRDCRLQGERGIFFAFPYAPFLPAFKKQQFSKAERRGEQIKVKSRLRKLQAKVVK